MGMKFTLKFIGGEKLFAALNSAKTITKPLDDGIRKITLYYDGLVKKATVVDTGRLRSSIAHEINPSRASVGTNVQYACVIGSRHQVYNEEKRTSSNIGNYKFSTVLSKDGIPHEIKARHRFSRSNIDCVSIQTRIGRKPLIVTNDHLILILRGTKVIWERANSLLSSDMIFGKRSHNAITDNSNKEPYLCFCGNVFWVKQSDLNYREPKFCSSKCRHKYGPHDLNTGMRWQLNEEQKRYGENNSQWRDGNCLKPYDSNFNGRLKEIIKERDGYQCQLCGDSFDLVVHHKDWDKMNSHINNLITLCRSCHNKLNRQDCELTEVNLSRFVPKSILSLKRFTLQRSGKISLPHLYDFTISGENSFMVDDILVHNSFIEYGTVNMEARHMEGSQKVMGEGMFAHAWGQLQDWLSKGKHDIHVEIDKEFK